ncbi:MAG: nicotinate-nucleotide--dimethylbenzimidazole phosphoribosyltransferase [Spirochaetaceae bacterium]|jgi:nicotinate-nucleotide--dimethylbenzimidazole phosphoribosyltransferase|nr:nicotinate-nucleotide--dimethylbenzimidazole phosphoribosyltransferase [Spirochaetaceae bacterium]
MAESKSIEVLMREYFDNPGSRRPGVGKLEDYALKMAKIQGRVPPSAGKKGIYVFMGDHGIAEEDVSASPPDAARTLALQILRGDAGLNAVAAGAAWEITVVDAGISGGLPEGVEQNAPSRLFRTNSAPGRNFVKGPALTDGELEAALGRGEELAKDAAGRGYYLTAVGESGAGSGVSAAAMLIAAGFVPGDMINRDADIDDARFSRVQRLITEAVAARNCDFLDGEEILKNFGSASLAMTAGFLLGLEDRGIACVLDGFSISAAAWAAFLINPRIGKYLFAGHRSRETGHQIMLDHLALEPVIDLALRSGEGVGAAIGGGIIELACLASGGTKIL